MKRNITGLLPDDPALRVEMTSQGHNDNSACSSGRVSLDTHCLLVSLDSCSANKIRRPGKGKGQEAPDWPICVPCPAWGAWQPP